MLLTYPSWNKQACILCSDRAKAAVVLNEKRALEVRSYTPALAAASPEETRLLLPLLPSGGAEVEHKIAAALNTSATNGNLYEIRRSFSSSRHLGRPVNTTHGPPSQSLKEENSENQSRPALPREEGAAKAKAFNGSPPSEVDPIAPSRVLPSVAAAAELNTSTSTATTNSNLYENRRSFSRSRHFGRPVNKTLGPPGQSLKEENSEKQLRSALPREEGDAKAAAFDGLPPSEADPFAPSRVLLSVVHDLDRRSYFLPPPTWTPPPVPKSRSRLLPPVPPRSPSGQCPAGPEDRRAFSLPNKPVIVEIPPWTSDPKGFLDSYFSVDDPVDVDSGAPVTDFSEPTKNPLPVESFNKIYKTSRVIDVDEAAPVEVDDNKRQV